MTDSIDVSIEIEKSEIAEFNSLEPENAEKLNSLVPAKRGT